MDRPTFEHLPEMVSKILEKIEVMEKLLYEKTLNSDDQEEMLNIKEAAIFLELAVPTLYSKVCRGEIPAHKPGKRLYFQKSKLLDWIKSGDRNDRTMPDLENNRFLRPRKLRRLK